MGVEFALEVNDDGDRVVLALRGEVDLQRRDEVADTAITYLAAKPVVLDLSKVTFIDSSGLGALIRARQAATRLGQSFSIRGATGPVARVLAITGLDELLASPDHRTDSSTPA